MCIFNTIIRKFYNKISIVKQYFNKKPNEMVTNLTELALRTGMGELGRGFPRPGVGLKSPLPRTGLVGNLKKNKQDLKFRLN